MFGKQSEQLRHEATRKYMNAKMSKGTPVRDHVLNMTNYINEDGSGTEQFERSNL